MLNEQRPVSHLEIRRAAATQLRVDVMCKSLTANLTEVHNVRTGAHRRRAGLTLVEMLVSVALTLMVVFALVQVFELLGDNVGDGRATIEISGNLRTAADLLREDLAGATVTTVPPRSPSQDAGYLELMDGPSTDTQHFALDVNGNPQPVNLSVQPSDADGYLVPPGSTNGTPFDSSVGDTDDILAFTSRRSQQPFTGLISDPRIGRPRPPVRYSVSAVAPFPMIDSPGVAPTQLIESHEAEIVWWVQPSMNTAFLAGADMNTQITNGMGGLPQLYPNGTQVRSLHRRVLLIRPDLDLSTVQFSTPMEVAAFLNTNDLSVRVVRVSGGGGYRVIPNSLADLTERENRAYRQPIMADATLRPRMDPLIRSSEFRPDLLLQNGALKDLAPNNGSLTFMMMRKGKDVVLGDVLGFDIQVWDPQAVVRFTDDGTAVTPSDPGYVSAVAANATLPNGAPIQGAYVDLGFASKLGVTLPGAFAAIGNPVTQSPNYPNRATYCTWSTKYESDGFNQDFQAAEPWRNAITDQGTNNLDDNGIGGIDDPFEMEVPPPYAHALRGVKISMRVMDPSTRQVRQTDVIHDFVAE